MKVAYLILNILKTFIYVSILYITFIFWLIRGFAEA